MFWKLQDHELVAPGNHSPNVIVHRQLQLQSTHTSTTDLIEALSLYDTYEPTFQI